MKLRILVGAQIDQLTIERDNLVHKLTACESEVNELSESLKQQKLVITSIDPNISFLDRNLTNYDIENYSLEISKRIKDLLALLNGKEIEEIDYSLVADIIEDRIMNVDGKSFILHVDTIIFSPKLIVFIEAKRHLEE